LQVARLAKRLLGESAGLVTRFLLDRLNRDGGFSDRSGKSDLYYTVFGLEGLLALGAEVPGGAVRAYLETFEPGGELDLVHLSSLARAWADLSPDLRAPPPCRWVRGALEAFRCSDGGYNAAPGAARGTVYGSFLALGAYQDLGEEAPDPPGLLRSLDGLKAADGSYANVEGSPSGQTPATAAAVALLRQLDRPAPPDLGRWLLARAHPQGGFRASTDAPLPDLLSTATALHGLAGLHVSFEEVKEPCLDFIDSLWNNQGGFHGNWTDDVLDCEYTWYALLALGHLSTARHKRVPELA
jgi:prenyltransferase beta subunit